jgi:hypothetical protein
MVLSVGQSRPNPKGFGKAQRIVAAALEIYVFTGKGEPSGEARLLRKVGFGPKIDCLAANQHAWFAFLIAKTKDFGEIV